MFDDTLLAPILPSEPEERAASLTSPAEARFASCRWQQPAENGTAAHCTHREVLAFAGTGGFRSDAWCPDCGHFKLRRARRRPSDG
jgi:hypothetical protein